MTTKYRIYCPWIQGRAQHAGYEVVQNYVSLAQKLNISIDVMLLYKSFFVRVYNKILTKSLFSYPPIHIICSLPMILYLLSRSKKLTKILYVEPHTILSLYATSLFDRNFGLIIHDDPICFLSRHGMSDQRQDYYSKKFSNCLNNARFGFVISQYMIDAYRLDNKDRFQVLHISYHDVTRESRALKLEDQLVLGLFGQPHAQPSNVKPPDPIRLIAKLGVIKNRLKIKSV